MSTEIPSSFSTAGSAKARLESLLDDLADLAESSIAQDQFIEQLSERTIAEVSALGTALWRTGPSNELISVHQTDLSNIYRASHSHQLIEEDQQSLERVVHRGGEPLIVRSVDQNREANHLIFACPIVLSGNTWGLFALYHSADLPQSAQNGYLQLATALSEIIVHYLSAQLLREHDSQQQQWNGYLEFAKTVHQDLDEKNTAYRIANQGRTLLSADRVTVATNKGTRCKVQAISGIDTINQRANVVKKLQRLIEAVIQLDQPLIYSGNTSDLAPQVELPLCDYLEESPSRVIAIFPLRELTNQTEHSPESTSESKRSPFGVLVVEQLEASNLDQLISRSNELVQHATQALHNARQYSKVPFRPVWQFIAWVLSAFSWERLPLTLKILIPICLAVTSTFFIQTDFNIELRGQLVPKVERQIYAPASADVEEVLVKHGDIVSAGQRLIELNSGEFLFQRTEITGELNNSIAELEKIRIQRTQNRGAGSSRDLNNRRPDSLDQLSADQLRLTKKIENLQKQLELIAKREQELQINSPISGQILSWNVDQSLELRPVQRGQSLLKVADIDGPWILQFELPDKSSSHVKQAQQEIQNELDITFQLVNEPGKKYQATLSELGQVVDTNQAQTEPVVKLVANFDKEKVDHLHRGLTVIGQVHCGKASVAYVWTHQLVESIRRRFFW